MAAGLAAELQESFPNADITYEPGPKKSEFAVTVDGAVVFSRLVRKRYPEEGEIVSLCKGF
ncbi:Rdx family protein [Seleniivibrio woodruffii]|uniref:SelT/selW/selH-like putative selenoprotein n=1 Tax=Seleniivibrio woodruffii TaxID=1078050 RepID=A0A4R1K3W9_9BACT|nr:Rdx family protein [Seleniivibrio woodruffii]TCK58403.1 selT/selW/selH-like putative selenoprotein [Seleniivibrio woodruffii]TVZ36776.1 selT/selW/selH-like putative selenoprotein [Seleniivibrio woodruffii]